MCKMELSSLLAQRENACLAPPSEIMELLPAGFLFLFYFRLKLEKKVYSRAGIQMCLGPGSLPKNTVCSLLLTRYCSFIDLDPKDGKDNGSPSKLSTRGHIREIPQEK